MIGINHSYISRIERQHRNHPRPIVLDHWLAACPLPILPSLSLAVDLADLHHAIQSPDADPPCAAMIDWQISCELSTILADTASNVSWLVRCVAALQWPAGNHLVTHIHALPEKTDRARGLAALLWMVLRSARYHQLGPGVFATLRPLADDPPSAVSRHAVDHGFQTLWEDLAACPAVEPEVPPRDVLFDQLSRLWPRLTIPARHAVVSAVTAFISYCDD